MKEGDKEVGKKRQTQKGGDMNTCGSEGPNGHKYTDQNLDLLEGSRLNMVYQFLEKMDRIRAGTFSRDWTVFEWEERWEQGQV